MGDGIRAQGPHRHTKTTGATMFVVVYTHKHGSDPSVYDSLEAAQAGVAAIMREWIDDLLPEGQARIRALLAAGNYGEATASWNDLTHEVIDYCECSVHTLVTNLDVMASAIDDGR